MRRFEYAKSVRPQILDGQMKAGVLSLAFGLLLRGARRRLLLLTPSVFGQRALVLLLLHSQNVGRAHEKLASSNSFFFPRLASSAALLFFAPFPRNLFAVQVICLHEYVFFWF